MDDAGFETVHIVGNSLGGYVPLQLAAHGRAESAVALAPAGGWAEGDESSRETLALFPAMQEQLKAGAPHAESITASAEGPRVWRRSCPQLDIPLERAQLILGFTAR